MNFKITVETEDLKGIEAIIDHLSNIEQAKIDKKLTVSNDEVSMQKAVGQVGNLQDYEPLMQSPQIPVQQIQSDNVMQQPIQQIPVQQSPQYTMDQLSLASRPIVEAGRQQELLDFLHSFKKADGSPVITIMDLPAEQYGAFATGLRQMGGKI